VRALLARKFLRVIEPAWQQLIGPRRRDDIGGAVAPELCPLGVERHEKVQPSQVSAFVIVNSAGLVMFRYA
jgi:hypothetical protein